MPGVPATNIWLTSNSVTISDPKDELMYSTHECDFTIPRLAAAAAEACIVHVLAHASLISTKKLIDTRYNVHFNDDRCSVSYMNTLIWKECWDEQSGLWIHPLTSSTNQHHHIPSMVQHALAHIL